MSPVKIQKRRRSVKITDAINEIEGVQVSSFAKELSDKWAEGTISDSQMIEMLISAHKKI